MGSTGTVNGKQPQSPNEPAARLPGQSSPRGHRAGRRTQDAEGVGATVRQTLDQRYRTHYRSLLRLGALLTGDVLLAEQVAATALVASVSEPFGLRSDPLPRLRRQVVLNTRRAMRVRRASPDHRPAEDAPGAAETVTGWTASLAVHVLGTLSISEREAVVLRYYLDLSEHETAALMGATVRTVRRCLLSAMAAFGAVLSEGSEDCPEAGLGREK